MVHHLIRSLAVLSFIDFPEYGAIQAGMGAILFWGVPTNCASVNIDTRRESDHNGRF